MGFWDSIRNLLFQLTPYLPGIVGFLIFLSVILFGVLMVVVYRVRKRRADDADDDGEGYREADPDYEPFAAEPDDIPLLPMRKSFKHALSLLRSHVAGRDWLYAIPWFLLLGPEQSGKSTLVSHAGMALPIGQPAEDFEDLRPACKWWFFDRGVVLDVAGGLVRQRDTRGANAKGWRHFLGYLDRFRPRRPADGIILTVPIEDFLDEQGAIRPPEDIAQRADALYKRLWQAQARLGLAFPVYVVVTKLDRLPGFKTLVGNLPDHALADMLGWSSPYSFETEFREPWADEVIETTSAGIEEAQMEIFATGDDPMMAEDIFAFTEAFEGLREPLRIYLRQLFKPSVYHDSFSLRGVWFSGDSGMEDRSLDRPTPVLSGVYGGPRARGAYPVFLRDLFETKIFPEKNSARPVRRALLSRNRVATAAQAGAAGVVVLGGLMLWYLHSNLEPRVATVTPFVETVRTDMEEVEATRRANPDNGTAGNFNRERALTLLEGMAGLETGSLFSLFIPTSWFADVNSRVVAMTTDAFNLFILETMGTALEERGRSVAAGRLSAAGDPDQSVFDELPGAATILQADRPQTIERGPEYEALRRYVAAVRDYETAVQRYNALRDSVNLEDLRRLVDYLFAVHLPESFIENSNFYLKALSDSNYRVVPLEAYRRDMRGQYEQVAQTAIASLYGRNPLVEEIRALAAAIDDASSRRTAGIDELDDIRNRIVKVRDMLGQPEFSWIDDPGFDPTTAYADMSQRIGGSRILGPELSAQFDDAMLQGLATLREVLPDIDALAVGPMLARDEDRTVLRLSPTVLEFASVVEALYGQTYMREARYLPLPALTPSAVSEWNSETLEEGLDLIEEHDAFLKDEIPRVPRGLQSLIRTATAQRVERAVNDRVAASLLSSRSRSSNALQTEEGLRRAVAAFSEAGPILSQILNAYDELGLEDSFLDLTDIGITSAFSLLQEADNLFSAGSLYTPRGGDFTWWDGGSGLSLEAFRARDVFELRDVLAQQRGRISIIAKGYAKPIVDFLGSSDMRLSDGEAVLLNKWRRIVDELTKYELQQADNTVAELERFITGPMMDVTFSTCAEVLDEADLERRSSDYFLDRISRLSRGIRARCLNLAGVEAQAAYNAIADSFDDNLAGRYPFTLTPYETDMREIAPRDLRAFFGRYDREVEGARRALEQADDLGFERDRALEFIARMDGVRQLFDPWLQNSGEDAPSFDLTVSFRVNRDRELGGDQVIDWQFASGGETVALRDAERTLRWGLGDPVEIGLRWAENSTVVPAANADRPNVRVDGRKVSMAYDNVWSLMDLIRRHRSGSEDFAEFVDPRPHTLRIDLSTRPEGGGTLDTARLYLRVELAGQLNGQPVPLIMTPFPYEAPRLSP